MPVDSGLTHRFPMLRRAIDHQVKNGRFSESLKLLEELLSLSSDDAGLSKLKARFVADLIKRAAQAQKREAGTQIVLLFEKLVPSDHLGNQERDLVAKAKGDLLSL